MKQKQILESIMLIVQDELDDDKIILTLQTMARDVENWDSLAHVRIMVAIEQKFSIRFSMTDITNLDNVGELVSLIQQATVEY